MKGKLALYEKAIIFEDAKLQCFVAEFVKIERVTTYLGAAETWMEFVMNDTTGLPLNTCFENKFILNVKDLYYTPPFAKLKDALKDRMTVVSEEF